MRSTIFWDTTPCSPFNANRRFGGTYRLHFQEEEYAEHENSAKAGGKQIFDPEDGGNLFLRNVG
jgi:hypothetical protein